MTGRRGVRGGGSLGYGVSVNLETEHSYPMSLSLNHHYEHQGPLGSWLVILHALLHNEVGIHGSGPSLFLHWLPISCPLAVINVTPSGSALVSSVSPSSE